MADRTSAEIFGELFKLFAQEATTKDKEYAREVWALSWGYDFHECQMECDEELVKLGLARLYKDEEGYPVYDYADSMGPWYD